jgi:hypothetical protein
MPLSLDTDLLLFFEDVDRDTVVRHDRRLRRLLRKAWYLLRRGRVKIWGFDVWFLLLQGGARAQAVASTATTSGWCARTPTFGWLWSDIRTSSSAGRSPTLSCSGPG